jgi:triosephosphate isomerase
MALKKLIAGNWKMHGVASDLEQVEAVAAASRNFPSVDVALCLPLTLIERAARAVPGFAIGAQDVHFAQMGAHTGNASAVMLKDAGASLTIVGHSERREAHREGNVEVKAKAQAALSAGLGVILCVGESLDVRRACDAVGTVDAQLAASLPGSIDEAARLSVAYEPIWAIGTGKVPTVEEIAEMHAALRRRLVSVFGNQASEVRILYGGSVKPANAREIFGVADVDGALVGGASLKAEDFLPIVEAAAAAVEAARPIA